MKDARSRLLKLVEEVEAGRQGRITQLTDLAKDLREILDAPKVEVSLAAACEYAEHSPDPLAATLRSTAQYLDAGDLKGALVNLHTARLMQAVASLGGDPNGKISLK